MLLSSIRKLLALALFMGAAWSIYIYGVGYVVSTSITEDDVTDIQVSVPSYLSADALVAVAENKMSSEKPEALAIKALAQDPANGGAAAFLLTILVSEGRTEEASVVADLAGRLWPVHTYTHSRLADYWISQDRVDKLVPELSLLLIREPGWRKTLFPVLEELIINADRNELLLPYINEPPNWWDSFFVYIAERLDLEVVSGVFAQRIASGALVSETERASFVRRLRQDGQWGEAFKQWRSGLKESESSLLVNGLFDGGFESNAVNSDFGWVFGRHKGVDMRPRATYGVTGKRALQLSFKRGLNRVEFKHLSQRLLLESGQYQLSFKARADALKNPKGLVWRIRCEPKNNQLLAEGKPLLGRHQWEDRSFTFVVPTTCAVQRLVLEAVSKYPHELVFNGKLWLDDVAISPVLGEINK